MTILQQPHGHVCTKIINNTTNIGWLQLQEQWQCSKPAVVQAPGEDKYWCQRHLNKNNERLANWIDRKGYVPVTWKDMEKYILKPKNSNVNAQYRCRKGAIYKENHKTSKFDILTELSCDPDVWCRKERS